MRKKFSNQDYLKPTSMTALLKMPSIEKEEIDNAVSTNNKSAI